MSKRDKKKETMDSELVYQELGQHLFLSSAIPMIMVDTDGIIVKVNQAYLDWSNLPMEALIGHYIADIVDNSRLQIVAKTGKAELHQIQRVFGTTILSTRLPIFNNKRELVGAWGMVDVNNYQSIKELQRRIENMKKSITQYKEELHSYTSGKYCFDDILGKSPLLLRAKADAAAAANSLIDVMIRGETGVGKELFAHAMHSAGPRANCPFISLNCSALSPTLAESELFGYEGGSFTDADKHGRPGKFEFANGGTLFLDEIGDLPISLQPKLLRAIESREVTRVGGHTIIPLDVQIMTATNCDLELMVEQGLFRRDLYYRLSAYMINIPPLRARKDDIPVLAQHFLESACHKFGREIKPISQSCMQDMLNHDWPGNVRELNNFVQNMIIRANPEEKTYSAPLTVKADVSSCSEKQSDSLADHEQQVLKSVLQQVHGNISKAAALLQVDRNTVYRKMKKYGLNKEDF